ncbi:MAG: hypothetical protein Q8O03_04440 [Nanoarchaeota archaeon]|nr:hypothetical protein [Nanoarchaeota archaeon]
MEYHHKNESSLPYESLEPSFGISKKLILTILGVFFALVIVLPFFFGVNDANTVTVIQYPWNTFSVKKDHGIYFTWGGKATVYEKSLTYSFLTSEDEGIPVRFNDGGMGRASGVDMFWMPANEAEILKVHLAYGRHEEVVEALIKPLTRDVMALTAVLMSSEEAKEPFNKEKFAQQVHDQLVNGHYAVQVDTVRVEDRNGKSEKIMRPIIRRDSDGRPLYGKNWLSEYGITVKLLDVKDLKVCN